MSQVAVIFGGPSPEHDVSILLGLPAGRALADAGHDVAGIYWAKTGDFYAVDAAAEKEDFYDGPPKKARDLVLTTKGFDGKKAPRPDVVVNCCHGGPGEDGSLQAALDLAGIPYTGPTVAGAALGMDKLAFGALVESAGLPTLPRALVSPVDDGSPPFAGPYIVKPRFGGSSIGIEIVKEWTDARALLHSVHYRAGAVAEPYRPDSLDLNIGLRSWPELQLSAIEKPLRSSGRGEILGYADKYLVGGGGEGMSSANKELPAVIPSEIEKQLRAAATTLAPLVGLRGVARLDFLYDAADGGLFVNEINTIPGSMAKYLWIEPEIPFGRLLADMVEEAARRPSTNWTTAGADGTALRSAGSIASKLG